MESMSASNRNAPLGGSSLDSRKIQELALLSMLAAFGLGLAWTHDEELFGIVFAMEAAFAAFEAIYLSL
jgi:hypothetical protein